MAFPELTERNYKRISMINWLLTPAMLILFSWPYYYLCQVLQIDHFTSIVGALFFASPFTMTVLHGHITMALGSLHRHHYYDWLEQHPLSFGLLFHPIMFRTRFRLILLLVSFIILLLSFVLP